METIENIHTNLRPLFSRHKEKERPQDELEGISPPIITRNIESHDMLEVFFDQSNACLQSELQAFALGLLQKEAWTLVISHLGCGELVCLFYNPFFLLIKDRYY